MKKAGGLGVHYLLNLSGCDIGLLKYADFSLKIGIAACKAANLTILSTQHHQFEPHGATALFLLKESHLSIHTWPEKGVATCDVFCCTIDRSHEEAKEIATVAANYLIKAFGASSHELKEIKR